MLQYLNIFGGSVALLFFATFSQSPSYKLQNYNIGSGGTNDSASSTYKLNASTGEVSGGTSTSSGGNQKILSSSIQAQQANVPLAPTLSNGSSTYYNQLGFIINTSSDPNDFTYSVAVSTDNFTTTKYVQADGTLGVSKVYQTYAAWGGASGSTMTGLTQNTTYQVKMDAKQGLFTNSAYGPQASIATVGPQLSFGISPSTVNLGTLGAGSIVSGSTAVTTFATNAASGGSVYIAGKNGGLKSTAAVNTIASYTGDLTSPSEGFGAQGASATQTSGGPLTIVSPFNLTGTNVGAPAVTFQPIFTTTASIVGGSATVNIKAKASTVTPAGQDYQEILTFVASASF